MTIKELKIAILLALYKRYKENKEGFIQLSDLYKEMGLTYNSLQQVSAAAKSLKSRGYIEAVFFVSGDGRIRGLTGDGVEYIEENLLGQEALDRDGLIDTSKQPIELDINDGTNDSTPSIEKKEVDNYKRPQIFKPSERFETIKDTDVEPCFSVNELADCFIKQLDTIGESDTENTPMIGVFAPWGRGKSYFLEHVFKQLEERNQKEHKEPEKKHKKHSEKDKSVKYKIVKFNAWKYQDTPAIWAYLFETIYKHTTKWQKISLYIKKRICSYEFWLWVALILILWIIGFLLKQNTPIFDKIKNLKAFGGIGTIIAMMGSFFLTLRDDPVSAYKIIQKYTHRKSYSECLGVQNAIEKDLEKFLCALTGRKDRVILCVDDIDRCSTEKMISIVDSLRTVLENDKIRKRLIVICSIDIDKLMDGYKVFYNMANTGLRASNVREQIDKLFIFGIGLPKLNSDQLEEYLVKLMHFDVTEDLEHEAKKRNSISKRYEELAASRLDTTSVPFSDKNIYKTIIDFLDKKKDIEITPRKLRVMYYQLLFANNLASIRGIELPKDLIEDLLHKSLTGKEVKPSYPIWGDIIETAVPY